MNCVNFREIEKEIVNRREQISELRKEIPQYTTIDEKLRVVVDPECKGAAVKLMQTIHKLEKSNRKDGALLIGAREIAEKYQLKISTAGKVGENPETLDIAKIESDAQGSKRSLEFQIKTGVLNGNITKTEMERLENEVKQREATITACSKASEELALLT